MAKFIDLDGLAYTYGKIKALISSSVAGKAEKTHTHAAGDITSGTLPVARGGTGNTSVDTTPTSGSTKMVTSGGVYDALAKKAATDLSNVDSTALANKVKEAGVGGDAIVTTAGDGAAYTAAVPGLTALTAGVKITIVTHTVSTSTTPTLNVNNLGAKQIRRRLSNMASSLEAGYAASWLASGKPFTVMYDGTYWVVEDMTKPAAVDLYGTMGVAKGGTGKASVTAGNFLVGNGTSAMAEKTPAEVLEAIGAAASSHNQAASTITAGTFAGAVVAKDDTDYTTYKLRNAAILSATPSSMTNGRVAFVYS